MYFLALHESYSALENPVPINATIVHAKTLLHRSLPQPDGGLMYRCLTEFPGRFPGCIVPLSTLTYELDGGALWREIGDWERVVMGIVRLSRRRHCDAMLLGLTTKATSLLSNGPFTEHTMHYVDGPVMKYGPVDREAEIATLTGHVRRFVADGPFRAGSDLVAPPTEPRVLPYQLFDHSAQ